MNDSFFGERLSQLRTRRNVSAREMSLAIGQNESYINRIENGRAYPSMQCFFYICEYLNVSPSEFFRSEEEQPSRFQRVVRALDPLNDRQLDIVLAVAEGLSDASHP